MKRKQQQNWWGAGEVPHLRWPGVTIEIPVVWSGKRWESSDGKYYFDGAAADFGEDFFPTMLVHHVGEFAGRKFDLLDYQRVLIRAAFGWKRTADNLRRFRKVFVGIPKGNGKSQFASGLALLLAFFDQEPGAEVYAVAADRKQARIVHDTCKTMVLRSPDLSSVCEVFVDSVKLKHSSESLQVLSSDAPTKHGFRPHGIIFDEFHAQPNRDLYDALAHGMGKRRQPMLVMITTAGDDSESICAEEWSYGENIIKTPGVDETYLPMIFQATPEDDWADPIVWRRCNPGFGVTVREDFFISECKAAQTEPRKRNAFLQLHLNRWVNQATAWLPIEWWDSCPAMIPSDVELQGYDVTAGLDMSQKYDLTAFVLTFRKPLPSTAAEVVIADDFMGGAPPIPLNFEVITIPFFWIPEDTMREHERSDAVPYSQWVRNRFVIQTAGTTIDYEEIVNGIRRIGARFPRLKAGHIAYDPAFATDIAQRLLRDGFQCVEVPQNARYLSEPSQIFEGLLKARLIRHDGNRCMRWCIENVAVKTDGGGRIRPVKQQQRKRIDGVVATIMALKCLSVLETRHELQFFVLG